MYGDIFKNYFLLIVPYGIETWEQRRAVRHARDLLIVPYGIETTSSGALKLARRTFNRTLWN